MKSILVVDESKAVRETVALILGRDFVVLQRPDLESQKSDAPEEEVDLLILGVSPGLETAFLTVSSRFSLPVLFLLDSRPPAQRWEGQQNVDYLAKPFHPYELRDKVTRLLAQGALSMVRSGAASEGARAGRYLEFPYLSSDASLLAKRYAMTFFPVLIIGELGSGHERVARGMQSVNKKAGRWLSLYPEEMSEEHLAQRLDRLAEREGEVRPTLFLNRVETLDFSAQVSLLRLLEREEARRREPWILSSSRADLLEKVYHGEFLDLLYDRLAMLTLRLLPLRQRQADLPDLVAKVSRECAEHLCLETVSFSPEAVERLCNYLWFGNLKELEAVVSRTLSAHRKSFIEAADLVLDLGAEIRVAVPARAADTPAEKAAAPASHPAQKGRLDAPHPGNNDFPDFNLLINELAHELKNPMVTIKTFAQLLGERYDDATFRDRFRESVGADIERMDDLLESLLDFSRFNIPTAEKIALHEQLTRVLEEMDPECLGKETLIRWGRRGENESAFVDLAHFRYAFKNLFRTALTQAKPGSEIQVEVGPKGEVSLSYVREGNSITHLARYLDSSPQDITRQALPLRILLAKKMLERNGGDVEMSVLNGGRVQITTLLPAP